MPVDAIVAVTLVIIAFAAFAVTLAWGLNRAGGRKAD